jgi:tol-pal system protein YbgF
MSFRFHTVLCASLALVPLCLPAGAFAQSGDLDPEMRIDRLENQLRTLTGQNEELQFRNRQLEEQLKALQSGAPNQAPGQQPGQQQGQQTAPRPAGPNVVAAPPVQQPITNPSVAATPPIVTAPAAGGRRGDAFDPNQNPNAPGAPRALGGGQLPVTDDVAVGAPGGRGAGEPLDLSNVGARNPNAAGQPYPQQAPVQGNATASLTTAPPSQTPRDEFDLGIGYIQRKDYALAEETMRNFAVKYPTDKLVPDSQYWTGESLFQRQKYREAAEAFLGVTTKYDSSAKAPDALLRLGQSLAALKEKEAACAAFGEITRKYPKASNGVKQGVGREQKRVGC